MAEGIRQACEDFLEASQDADFLLQAGVAHGGVEIAELLGIPMAFSYLHPYTPTSVFPSVWVPSRASLGGAYNRLTQRLALRLMWGTYGPPLNRWRAERFGLPPWRSHAQMLSYRRSPATPNLLGYSPALLPKPADWDATHHVTGFWYLDPPPDWQAPPELQQFLDSGPPPVYVGFGSMHGKDPQRLTREVLRALEISGQRGLLLGTGGGGLARQAAPPGVMYIDEVPHAWLFPRMAAVVHHGGAGTTANVVRAGVPGIIAPRILDQFTWADRVQKLGIGLRVSEMSKLTAEQLAPAIRAAANDSAMRARAAAFGGQVEAENGIARAVGLIEDHAAQFHKARQTGAH
jgi:sterol 3beta-glucosyltransferase